MSAMEANFSHQLREYQLYAEVIKGVLCRRDAMQMEYEITVEEASRKKDEVCSDLVLPNALAELLLYTMNARLPTSPKFCHSHFCYI